ncbi:MAG: acetate/propionate family kinase [Alphaproteobacteria bacterium]
MSDAILVLNAGSSSLKFALFDTDGKGADPVLALRGQVAGIGAEPRFEARDDGGRSLTSGQRPGPGAPGSHAEALSYLLEWLERRATEHRLVAAGHRVVHGGNAREAPACVDRGLIDEIASLSPLAPHHQPHNLAAIEALARRLPDLPQVACFDTAFHTTQPLIARRLALPRELRDKGLRRYGFHGLSYEYIVSALPEATGEPLPRRLVVAHLGNGASMCAIEDGRSIATTMGFSTLDGLPMGTRCGVVDPDVILYLMREEGMDEPALTDLFYNRCGLLGLSGISADMRVLLESDAEGAAEAVELYCYRIAREVGSMAAALGGLDAIVFTGGIGEHAAPVRARVCRRLAWLGVALDVAANAGGGARISTPGSRTAAWVLATDEELMIARHTRALM